jgi:hypothetical protein
VGLNRLQAAVACARFGRLGVCQSYASPYSRSANLWGKAAAHGNTRTWCARLGSSSLPQRAPETTLMGKGTKASR